MASGLPRDVRDRIERQRTLRAVQNLEPRVTNVEATVDQYLPPVLSVGIAGLPVLTKGKTIDITVTFTRPQPSDVYAYDWLIAPPAQGKVDVTATTQAPEGVTLTLTANAAVIAGAVVQVYAISGVTR